LLINLRNTLVHFKPEWSHEDGKHKKLMNSLQTKFPFSPYFQNVVVAFPHAIMCYGCAKWSVTTTVNYLTKFSELADIPNKLDKFQDRLTLD
jgi:hypothetical protein